MHIELLDLDINNLSSVYSSIQSSCTPQDKISIVRDLSQSKSPDLMVLPGLGHFGAGMASLKSKELDSLIKRHISEKKKIVGICLGMQLLCEESEEAPGIEGLAVVRGSIRRLPAGVKIPHVGWNSVSSKFENTQFSSLQTGKDFYFVHSYHADLSDRSEILTTTPLFDIEFCSSFLSGNVLGFQFHPEKSGRVGRALISEIIEWARPDEAS